jgi:23S rRNA (guanine745-N1)-methyltransferase
MNALRCPLCQLPLSENLQGLACTNRHQFDRAKEDYFNLLPVQNKHSLEPGDAKEQLHARRQFLRAGFFQSLQQELKLLIPKNSQQLLDIGCGEGYFTAGIAEALPNAKIYGFDIAKTGIRLAARAAQIQQQTITYGVASSFDLPLQSDSMDVITRIFAPSKDEELQRVLKANGLLIIVTPGDEHLIGLRQRIYQQVKPHQVQTAPQGFVELEKKSVLSRLQIENEEFTKALLTMTPFAWRISNELREDIVKQPLSDQLHFVFNIYRPQ